VSLSWVWTEGVQDQCVSRELNTLLTALYVVIDDHVVTPRAGRGGQPLLSDSELITLAVARSYSGGSGREWLLSCLWRLWSVGLIFAGWL
jgi:hypothetical protein